MLAGLLLRAGAIAAAQTAPPIARYVPPVPDATHVFVLDSAHILSAAMIAALQDSSRALQAETGADIAWVTLPTLGGRPIEEAGLYIGRTWRVGSAGTPGDPLRNRGLVVLYVPNKATTAGPNFRVEVGNGLEGTITDSRSRAIANAMRDSLRLRRVDAAYRLGWAAAASLVREDALQQHVIAAAHSKPMPHFVQPAHPAKPRTAHNSMPNWYWFAGFFVFYIVALFLNDPNKASSRDRDSSSSGDSGSGGGGGDSDFGGGGGFSGGGSSDTI